MTPEAVSYASGRVLFEAYRTNTLDPVAAVEHQIERIRALDPALNAFRTVLEGTARAEAEASAARWRGGVPLGPLDGVPVAVKDLADVAGVRAGCGSRAVNLPPAATSATVVRRLRAAGVVILGKTQMVEFACGGWGTNAMLGTPRNPWDRAVHRVPGGSSSGSAVAVAAGLVTAAIGSDTGGSVRIPAAFCGLTGLKTSLGRVSVAGTFPLAKTFDTLGPLARSAQDAALVVDAIHGPDPRDPVSLRSPPELMLDVLERGIAGLRVAAMPRGEREGVDAGVLAAYDAALETLRAAGAEVRDVVLPESFDDVRPRCGRMIMAEGYAATREWIDLEKPSNDPHVRARLMSGRDATFAEISALEDDLLRTRAEWQRAMEGIDVLVTPTVPIPAPPVAEVDETSFLAARFTRAGNYLDWCAAAVPMGLVGGLPVSLQIYSWPRRESLVLRVAAAFQANSAHHLSRPALG